MEAKTHTAGPWKWQLFGDTYMLTAQHGRREIIVGAIQHGVMKYPVVAMASDGVLQDVDPIHPNAKLIAAAPELLEALEGLTDYFDFMIDDPTFNERIKAIEAIKKATYAHP